MKRVTITEAEFKSDETDPPGFRASMARVGPSVGAELTGASAYDIPPGEALCPYHYECGEEEWLLVLEGNATVRDPDGDHLLGPMELAFFERGAAGAHGIRNDSNARLLVLMFSNVVNPTATVYPDSDKIGIWTPGGGDDVIVRRSAGVSYYDGEA